MKNWVHNRSSLSFLAKIDLNAWIILFIYYNFLAIPCELKLTFLRNLLSMQSSKILFLRFLVVQCWTFSLQESCTLSSLWFLERGRSLGQLRTKRAASTLFLSFDLSKTGPDGSSSVPQIVRPHCSHILSKPVRVKKTTYQCISFWVLF